MIVSITAKQETIEVEAERNDATYPIRVYLNDTSMMLTRKEAEKLTALLNSSLQELDLLEKQ